MVVNMAVAATLALSLSAASAESARASLDAISTHGSGIGTHVSQNITSNTTWTALGSLYIIIANISVASGATLTIEPGVVVMFQADAFRTLTINGTIRAVATSDANRITFTSLNDDTVAGDVNGGGWSVGEEGDWWHIQISSGNALSEFRYVDIRFGGYGSSPSGYGAIKVTNGSHVTIDHATIADNAQSGVLVEIRTSCQARRAQIGTQWRLATYDDSLLGGCQPISTRTADDWRFQPGVRPSSSLEEPSASCWT